MTVPRIGPGDRVYVRGPDTLYRWVGLETAGPVALVKLETLDGLDWSADRQPVEEEPEVPRRVDEQARQAYTREPEPVGLAAARIGIEHIEHHGQPLRYKGSSYPAGDVIEHRFACREQLCPFVLTWRTES